MKAQALLTVVALVITTGIGADLHIKTTDELITFSNNVNGGSTYEGSTVFLDNDIDFSETTSTFTPIGSETTLNNKLFRGIFDGQGYTINNLTLKSSEKHVGLFGYSTGMTVKNVVIGSTSSIECTYEGTDSAYFGAVIGECVPEDGECAVENVVNMADVTFSGKAQAAVGIATYYAVGGGVYGRFGPEQLSSVKFVSITRNCANYGTVTHKGTSDITYLGGLRGGCRGSDSHKCITENCLNAGSVVFLGSTKELYIGGFGGNVYYNELSNCVSIGEISTNQSTSNIGAFVGGVGEGKVNANGCVWTDETGMISGYGSAEGEGKVKADALSSSSSTLNATTLAILNENDGRKWILNNGRHTVEFYVNGALTMSANTVLIQQPDFGGNGGTSSFNGWYSDASCTEEFTTYETSGDLRLYGTYGVLHTITFVLNDTAQTQSRQSSGKSIVYPADPTKVGHTFNRWNNTGIIEVPDYDITFTAEWTINNYAVTFDFGNGTILNETLPYNKDIDFPDELINTGYTFLGWNNTGISTVPGYDITFTAQWIINNYTVTFDFGNGTILNETLQYNEEIDFPENLTRTNYTFIGWNNIDIIKVPDYDITFTAQWVEGELNNYVEIVFNRKDITQEEAQQIIEGFGDYDFTIERFGTNDDSNAFVIIRFEDVSEAMNFVETIKSGSEFVVKSINFVDTAILSLSHMAFPFFFPLFALIF